MKKNLLLSPFIETIKPGLVTSNGQFNALGKSKLLCKMGNLGEISLFVLLMLSYGCLSLKYSQHICTV